MSGQESGAPNRVAESTESIIIIIIIVLLNLVLSANIFRLLTTQSGRSLTKSKNSNGPITDPCGTPLKTRINSVRLPLIFTPIVLDVRNCPIHLNKLLLSPMCFNLSSSLLCETLGVGTGGSDPKKNQWVFLGQVHQKKTG